MNIGLGKQDIQEVEHAFRQSFTLMWMLSTMLLLFGETFGLWFVYNKLVIPPDRMVAALWVYQFSLVSVLSAINQVPLMGAIVAHEKMNMYAYLGLFEAFARLLIAYLLKVSATFDSLILYGMLTALVSVITWLFYAVYCVRSPRNDHPFAPFLWPRSQCGTSRICTGKCRGNTLYREYHDGG